MPVRTRSVLRPGIKVIALASILGVAAYLVLGPEGSEPQQVHARYDENLDRPLPADAPSVEQTQVSAVKALARAPGASAKSTLQIAAGLPLALEKATPQQKQTADRLFQFFATGDMAQIRSMTSDEVQSLAGLFADELGNETLAAAMESHFGLPATDFLAQEDPTTVFTDLFDAVGNERGPTNMAPVVFTDQVEADGTVTGNVHVIPTGTKRVYAAFENAGALQGLERVLAIWRNPSNDRMMFTEYEPIRKGSVYNYVWLELEEGWPTGFYQLDLYHPTRTSERLASRSFNVR